MRNRFSGEYGLKSCVSCLNENGKLLREVPQNNSVSKGFLLLNPGLDSVVHILNKFDSASAESSLV